MAEALPNGWIDEMKRAGSLAEKGVPGAALRILDRLYANVRAAGRDAVGDWHRIQILWVKGTILEEAGHYSAAARVYETIVRFRKAQMEEAGYGLMSGLAAAAVCKAKSGQRTAAIRLAHKARHLLAEYPDDEVQRELASNPAFWTEAGPHRSRKAKPLASAPARTQARSPRARRSGGGRAS